MKLAWIAIAVVLSCCCSNRAVDPNPLGLGEVIDELRIRLEEAWGLKVWGIQLQTWFLAIGTIASYPLMSFVCVKMAHTGVLSDAFTRVVLYHLAIRFYSLFGLKVLPTIAYSSLYTRENLIRSGLLACPPLVLLGVSIVR